MTPPNGQESPEERIARLEASQSQLAREVQALAGSVDRFVQSTQEGFHRVTSSLAQVERALAGEIAAVRRPNWQAIGVAFGIAVAGLGVFIAPITVRQSATEAVAAATRDQVERDHHELTQVRIDTAVLLDRAGRAAKP